jgi:DNA modification methylase
MPTLSDIGGVKTIKGHSTGNARWATFGPYYAMFPISFAFEQVEAYSKEGDYIIDPFAGRFSSVYAGGVLGRNATGIEISPVGWLYGKTKVNPANEEEVLKRLVEICELKNNYFKEADALPEFFHYCYSFEVRKFLLSAKWNLDWENDDVDSSLMSIILVYLHGKLKEGISNQMRQTKAMGLNYSINWWKKNNLEIPPEVDTLEFFIKKINWRYRHGKPIINTNCQTILGDSTSVLKDIITSSKKDDIEYSLLITSPPYFSVVDYHADQWIRLWLLGQGNTKPQKNNDKHRNRFSSESEYISLLDNVFGSCAKLMKEDAKIVVRTDIRKFTLSTTLEILKKHFPEHNLTEVESIVKTKNQTELFGNKSKKKEVDLLLSR